MNELRGLWRGKRLDNGDWAEGDLTRYSADMGYIIVDLIENEVYQVDGNTLGEFTGLTDKNGKFVFEGDIIKTKKYGKIAGHSNVNDYDIFVVKYDPAVFRLENHNRGFNLVDDGYSKFKVIGNVHDNPGLLKGAEDETMDKTRN